jgi:hypothetical protein
VGFFPRNAHIYGLAGHFVAKSIFLFFGEGLKRQLPLVFGRVPGGGKGKTAACEAAVFVLG